MKYNFIYTDKMKKDLKKLDNYDRKRIIDYIENNLINTSVPYNNQYKELTANLKGYGRYKVGNYRILVEIKNNLFIIRGLKVGHRKQIYIK